MNGPFRRRMAGSLGRSPMFYRAVIKEGETLATGGYCQAYLQRTNYMTGSLEDGPEVRIHDVYSRNMGVAGDGFDVRFRADQQRYEIVGGAGSAASAAASSMSAGSNYPSSPQVVDSGQTGKVAFDWTILQSGISVDAANDEFDVTSSGIYFARCELTVAGTSGGGTNWGQKGWAQLVPVNMGSNYPMYCHLPGTSTISAEQFLAIDNVFSVENPPVSVYWNLTADTCNVTIYRAKAIIFRL